MQLYFYLFDFFRFNTLGLGTSNVEEHQKQNNNANSWTKKNKSEAVKNN